MTRYVGFLRAINTPPRHVKMVRLIEVFESLGFDRVTTFIASGNVVFDAEDDSSMAERIESALHAELGFEVPAFLRSTAEVIDVAGADPFPDADEVEVSFLKSEPEPADARALEETAAGVDRLAVIGREVYWGHSGPRSGSKHTETRVVRTLGMMTTQRSMRTVRRLVETRLR
jgi:uncharacterized protein (DUF1697 family)